MRDGAVELLRGEGEGTGELRMRAEAMSGDAGCIKGELGKGSAAGSVFDLVRVYDGLRGAAVDGVRPAAFAFARAVDGVRVSVLVVVVGVL